MKKISTSKYGLLKIHHTCTESPEPQSFEKHCHSYYELLYIVNGRGKCMVEGMEYPLLPNTILLLRPNEYHYVCPDRGYPYERYVIHFSGKILLDATNTLSMLTPYKGGAGVYFQQDTINEQIQTQFQLLDVDYISAEETDGTLPTRFETLIRTSVNQILLLLSYLRPDTPEPQDSTWLSEVIRYLNENLAREITLEETARHFFVSKYHLCHAFRAHTGISVFSYLTTKRLALAEQLLEAGIPASEVAEQVGFRDYSVFYRAYKKATGVSPSHVKRPKK